MWHDPWQDEQRTQKPAQADAAEATTAPLPVIQVESLETTEVLVRQAGGVITKPIFGFPGGRRFHFRDPSGNELAAMQVA